MDSKQYYRKVIRITAEDSPNVILALEEVKRGLQPSNRIVVPGVLSYSKYLHRRATWDPIRQCIGLDAQFYKGSEVLLYPTLWLNRAEEIARALEGKPRQAEALGIDPAEGGDSTSMAVVDRLGLIELVSKKTPDTSVIVNEALAMLRRYPTIPHEKVIFDAGGGGKQHADRMRQLGYQVRTVAFGEGVTPGPKRGMTRVVDRVDEREERYAYAHRRDQMYGDLRELLDPTGYYASTGFGIPARYHELRRELAPIPLMFDPEGRMKLLSKHKRSPDSKEKTLTELIGHSPDNADSLVLAIHGMLHVKRRIIAGSIPMMR